MLGFVLILLQEKDAVEVQLLKWEAFFVLLSKRSQDEVVFSIITRFYEEFVVNKLKKTPLHGVDLSWSIKAESLVEAVILKRFIIPDLKIAR